ncbi:hypothetical protein [Microbacterium sp. 22242]|uniref:hypothetical protein n=1 Tax=Microbacterium sp. 22242 TaxID=3453896 RepID=UPI003F841327
MARREDAGAVHRIHSLPEDAPWEGGMPPAGSPEHPLMIRGLDRVLAVQRPLVLAHIRSIRLRHPGASPAEIIVLLERRYLAAVTTGGAAVGATAVIPGITTGVTLALSGVETAGFVESTALFAQSVAEVHGISVTNPERARALVMTLMLGKEGVDLIRQLAGQAAGNGAARSAYWGELVTKSLPSAAVGPLTDRLKSMLIKHFAAAGGASLLGKALPFGIGAVIGGAGNHVLGRRVLTSSRRAFGPPPQVLPAELEPVPGAERLERKVARGAQLAGSAVAGAAGTAARGVGVAGRRAQEVGRRAQDLVRRHRAPISGPEAPGPQLHPDPPSAEA